MTNYWLPIEREWQSAHVDSLRPVLSVVAEAHDLVALVATHPDLVNAALLPVVFVERLLVRRLGEELRARELLAEAGHGFQTMGIACNVFEVAHNLTAAVRDNQAASDFLEWSDRSNALFSVSKAVQISGECRGWSADRCTREYDVYRLLCAFKHNNPMSQRILKLDRDPDLFMCQFGLAEAVWLTLSSIGLVAMRYIRQDAPDTLNSLNNLMDRAAGLIPNLDSLTCETVP